MKEFVGGMIAGAKLAWQTQANVNRHNPVFALVMSLLDLSVCVGTAYLWYETHWYIAIPVYIVVGTVMNIVQIYAICRAIKAC